MAAMKRWRLDIFAAVSLLLVVGTLGMWVRSYWYEDELSAAALVVDSHRGIVTYLWEGHSAKPWSWFSAPSSRGPRYYFARNESSLGVGVGRIAICSSGVGVSRTIFVGYYLYLSYWAFCLLESLLPVAWLIHRLRSRTRKGSRAFPVEIAVELRRG